MLNFLNERNCTNLLLGTHEIILRNPGVTHSVPTAVGNGMGHAWVTKDDEMYKL